MSELAARVARWAARKLFFVPYYWVRKKFLEPIFWLSDVMTALAVMGVTTALLLAQWQSAERRRLAFVAAETQKLAEAVYFESRGIPRLGQLMVAYVIMERVKAARPYWGGGTVRGVVDMKRPVIDKKTGRQKIDEKTGKPVFVWEFSYERGLPIRDKAAWSMALSVAEEAYRGRFRPPGQLVWARYYMNPKGVQKCRTREWFYKKLFLIDDLDPEVAKALGGHEFFREPQTRKEKLATKDELDICGTSARLPRSRALFFFYMRVTRYSLGAFAM